MPLPRDRGTVGQEYQAAQRDLLRDVAWEALRLHRLLDRGAFGQANDVKCFHYDCERLNDCIRELEANHRNALRYYETQPAKAPFLGRDE